MLAAAIQVDVGSMFRRGDNNFDKVRFALKGKFRVLKINHCDGVPEKYEVLGEENSEEDAKKVLRANWSSHDMQDCCTITIFNENGHGVWNSAQEAAWIICN